MTKKIATIILLIAVLGVIAWGMYTLTSPQLVHSRGDGDSQTLYK